MDSQTREIEVQGQSVQVVRKRIKNLYMRVHPPDGRVRVSAPLRASDEDVRAAVSGNWGWIRKQQTRFSSRARPSGMRMETGENHFFLGRCYRLRVTGGPGRKGVSLREPTEIELRVSPGAGVEFRKRALLEWYRRELRRLIPPLLDKWQPLLGVEVAEWGIKRMKTRWGTCNPRTRRIWLNLELAQRPPHLLEYIVVHELAHLIERRHGRKFVAIMDGHLPEWRQYRRELKTGSLGEGAG